MRRVPEEWSVCADSGAETLAGGWRLWCLGDFRIPNKPVPPLRLLQPSDVGEIRMTKAEKDSIYGRGGEEALKLKKQEKNRRQLAEMRSVFEEMEKVP